MSEAAWAKKTACQHEATAKADKRSCTTTLTFTILSGIQPRPTAMPFAFTKSMPQARTVSRPNSLPNSIAASSTLNGNKLCVHTPAANTHINTRNCKHTQVQYYCITMHRRQYSLIPAGGSRHVMRMCTPLSSRNTFVNSVRIQSVPMTSSQPSNTNSARVSAS